MFNDEKVLTREQLYEEVWATPMIYGGRLYVRGFEQLICLDIGDR